MKNLYGAFFTVRMCLCVSKVLFIYDNMSVMVWEYPLDISKDEFSHKKAIY